MVEHCFAVSISYANVMGNECHQTVANTGDGAIVIGHEPHVNLDNPNAPVRLYGLTVANNIVTDTTGSSGSGIVIRGSVQQATVTGNVIYRSQKNGIQVQNCGIVVANDIIVDAERGINVAQNTAQSQSRRARTRPRPPLPAI